MSRTIITIIDQVTSRICTTVTVTVVAIVADILNRTSHNARNLGWCLAGAMPAGLQGMHYAHQWAAAPAAARHLKRKSFKCRAAKSCWRGLMPAIGRGARQA